jgi:ribA/ribD-fused uncharacterized protein
LPNTRRARIEESVEPPLTVEDLRERVAAGWEPSYLFFWGHTGRPGSIGRECLSQWYPAPFVVDGITYETAEHYMMHRKAILFGDAGTAARILAASHPGEAKMLGRTVRDFDEGRWVTARFDIVIEASVAKFSQNPELRAFLSGTRRHVLVEASPRDSIWGIGLSEADADARSPDRWPGLNLLGFALMRARTLISGTE